MIIGIEMEKFFEDKGASPDCPRWIFPQGENWAFYHDDNGIRLDDNGISCEGQKSRGGNMNPRCEHCPIRGIKYNELNSENYVNLYRRK